MDAHEQQVRRLWAAYEARDWIGARALFAAGAQCIWWTSGERMRGPDAIVHVNAVYPEGWHIEVLAIEPLREGRVLSRVRVDHGAVSHYATRGSTSMKQAASSRWTNTGAKSCRLPRGGRTSRVASASRCRA